MLFGIYCEVSIETLRQIQLKYVEDYESLVQFLADFHMIKNQPSVLAVDGLDFYLENKNLSQLTKKMRLHFLLSMIKDCQGFLQKNDTFKANNLIVSYRCQQSSTDTLVSDFQKLYSDFSGFTQQIYYLSRSEVSGTIDKTLLKPEQVADASVVELYIAEENQTYFEEEHQAQKIKEQDGVQPEPFRLKAVGTEAAVFGASLFNPILKEIREGSFE